MSPPSEVEAEPGGARKPVSNLADAVDPALSPGDGDGVARLPYPESAKDNVEIRRLFVFRIPLVARLQ
jgi:hypothetical protein